MSSCFRIFPAACYCKALLIFGIFFSLTCDKMLAQESDHHSVFNIIDYGAKPDGKTVNTMAIQATVNACHKAGGGTIEIPAGEFVTGTIRLHSNMELHLDAGAVLSGSLN